MWEEYLRSLCIKHELTLAETQVLICLKEEVQDKSNLLQSYREKDPNIGDEAFTQRLKGIYDRFDITGNGRKLPRLCKYIHEKYERYKSESAFFSSLGFTHIYPRFPTDIFGKEINNVINSNQRENKKVDIFQTFAPNLDDYSEYLIQCVQNDVRVRILLAWPYSEAAKLREDVLRRYANNSSIVSETNICDYVIANLETLEKVIQASDNSEYLDIKLYDTLPSLAIYRAGDYMLAAPFMHGALAINTFQLELKLNTSNQLITKTLQKDFELMWQVSRKFSPDPERNWRNDLKILFTR